MTTHPGDHYARGQLENWFILHLGIAERHLADATAKAAAALGGIGSAGQARAELDHASQQLAQYEAGYAAYQAGAQPHYQLVERFSRVCGSAGGPADADALAAAFVPAEPTASVNALVELGLDPSIEPGLRVDLSGYAAADRAYRVRWSICQDAMRRWGWWMPGDPPTAEMREEETADLEAEDAWRVSVGLDPMWTEAIAELRSN